MNFMLIGKVVYDNSGFIEKDTGIINERFEAVNGSDAVGKAKDIIKEKYPRFVQLEAEILLAETIWTITIVDDPPLYESKETPTMHLNLLG